MKELQKKIRDQLKALVQNRYGIPAPEIGFTMPPQRKFGDLSTNLPFGLAAKVKKAPRQIGEEIAGDLTGKLEFIRKAEVAGGGFLNFFFENRVLFEYLLHKRDHIPGPRDQKVIVEHTSINPNKAAHIGHLRNSILGDTLALCLGYLGYRTEIQNYIDDTGIQVSDVVWGLLRYRKKSIADIRKIPDLPVFLWDLYTEVSQQLGQTEEFRKERDAVHQRIEKGLDPEAEVCRYLSDIVLKDHIRIMNEIGIRYDLLVRESDIINLDLFEQVREKLARSEILYPSSDPDKKGCLVIRYEKGKTEKVIIRSNGTLTYIAKDLAYAFWKMGLIKGDFQYRRYFTYGDDKPVYISRAGSESADSGAPSRSFGRSNRAYNVIGIRQAYLQEIISQVIGSVTGGDKHYVHFYYEMVSLSPDTVRALGIPLSPEEARKKAIDVSGRRGVAITADHLIEELYQQALREVEKRNRSLSEDERNTIARQVSVAALRYFMIRYNATSPITFDFTEALSFEGNSGPYILYTVVRINSIFRKLGLSPEDAFTRYSPVFARLTEEEQEQLSEILFLLGRIELEVEFALESQDLSILAAYTYRAAQKLNHYYHRYPVVAEPDTEVKGTRILFLAYARQRMALLSSLLGISIPERM